MMKLLGVAMAVVTLAGCGGSTPSPEPSDPGPDGFFLRAVPIPDLPPEDRFGASPSALITDDGIAVMAGAVPAIFPGPLVQPLVGAPVSEAGFGRIVERARALGLLGGAGDFTPPDAAPGGPTGRIQLRADGTVHDIVGEAGRSIECVTTPCDPPAGSPEAFGTFWREISDLRGFLGDALGPDAVFQPDGYALLIGVEPPDGGGVEPGVVPWPLDGPVAEMGAPISDGSTVRCATVRGDDSIALGAALAGANQLTRWFDAGTDPAGAVSIRARPLLPGDGDVCGDLFGVAG